MIDGFPYWTDPEKDQFEAIVETCLKSEDHYQVMIAVETASHHPEDGVDLGRCCEDDRTHGLPAIPCVVASQHY